MTESSEPEPHLDLDALEESESSGLGPSLRDLMEDPDAYPAEMAQVREAMKGLSAVVMPKIDFSGFASSLPKIDVLPRHVLGMSSQDRFEQPPVEIFRDPTPTKQLEALTQVVQALTVANAMHERQIDQQSQQIEHQKKQFEEQERSSKGVTRREWIAISVAVVSLIVAVIAIL